MEPIHLEDFMRRRSCIVGIALVAISGCGSKGSKTPPDTTGKADGAAQPAATDGKGATGGALGTVLGGCQILPTNHIFNTPIDTLPVHGSSAAFMTTIGTRNIHLDLGTSTDMASGEYYGIPYNIVNGNSLNWIRVSYLSTDPSISWDPLAESDCVDQSSGATHTLVSPCLANKAPNPWLPITTD